MAENLPPFIKVLLLVYYCAAGNVKFTFSTPVP